MDGCYPPYYVYENDKLFEIEKRWIVRDYNVAYPIKEVMWDRFCNEGVHSAFNAKLMVSGWKPSARAVVVIMIPSDELPVGDSCDFLWCLRVSIHTDHVAMNRRLGNRFLWPLSPSDAHDMWTHFACSQTDNQSRLVTDFLPWASLTANRPLRSWLDLPGTLELKRVPPDRGDVFMIAAVRPTIDGMRHVQEVKRFMQLPDDLTRRVSTARERVHACFFDVLSIDEVYSVLTPLVNRYIYTPAREAHLNWTALRLVSRSFRESIDATASGWIAHAVKLADAAIDYRKVSDALALRDFVVPTGLDVLQLLHEIYMSAGRMHSPRWRLLVYMRLRARKSPRAMPPPAPVKSPSENEQHLIDFGPRMSMTHGRLLRHSDDSAGHTHHTRSKGDCDVPIRIRMVMRIPHYLVTYINAFGWQSAP